MSRLLIVAALSALAACSDPDVAEPVATPAPATSADVAGAEAFVRAIYEPWINPAPASSDADVAFDPSPDYFSTRMQALIDKDRRLTPDGYAPALNYDPICSCQDSGEFTLDRVEITSTGETTADAAVAFTNMDSTARQTFKLIQEGGGWKVDDIVSGDVRSLAAFLQDSNAENAALANQG